MDLYDLFWSIVQGVESIYKDAILPILEIPWSYDRLISTMGFPTLVNNIFVLNRGPGSFTDTGTIDTLPTNSLVPGDEAVILNKNMSSPYWG